MSRWYSVQMWWSLKCGRELWSNWHFCNADLVVNQIELLRATLSWQVLQNDSKILWDENIFISSEERSPKVRSSKIWLKHALQSLDKNGEQCCCKYTQSGSLSSLNNLSFSCDSMYLAHVLKRSSVNSFRAVSVAK